MTQSITIILLAVIALIHHIPGACAGPSQELITQELRGIVTAVRANSISILYNWDKESGSESEMSFPLDGSAQLINRREWEDVKLGDKVTVVYEQLQQVSLRIDDEGQEERFIKVFQRKPLQITFEEKVSTTLISKEQDRRLRE